MPSSTNIRCVIGAVFGVSAVAIAAFAWVLPTNEYQALGVSDAWDCDGPITTTIVCATALAAAWIALGLAASIRHTAKIAALALVGVVALAHVAVFAKAPEVVRELERNEAPDSPCH